MSNTYCSINEAFNTLLPQKKRKKNNFNNPITTNIENFECLNGSNQMDMNEYKYKHSLIRNRPEELSVDTKLDKQTAIRQDEKYYYPDMSLESEYAVIEKDGSGYRPPNPFTTQTNPSRDMKIMQATNNNHINDENESSTQVVNGGMYESFNLFSQDSHMTPLDSNMETVNYQNINDNLESHPAYQTINNTNYNTKNSNNHNNVGSDEDTDIRKLSNSYKKLEKKLNMILAKLDKIDSPENDKENVHDIILFSIFGVFFIYILDSVYRIGKKSNK